jgi:tRNA(Ile)-lysidine synthase
VAKLPQIVSTAIRRQRLLPEGGGCVVAVSGGLDSVVLLHLLSGMARHRGWSLHVAHLNHRLRGRASDGDEQFVRRLAGSLGWPVTCGAADVAREARERGCPVELAARDLRHAFLAAVARETGSRRVALGHHANDQTETFLIRLLRGAAAEGLGALRWESPSPADGGVILIRPLLATSRTELEAWARAEGLSWREDASNREEGPLRNWLRGRVLPLLETRTRGAVHRLVSQAAQTLAAEANLSRELADRWLKRAARRPRFDRLPVAVQRQVIVRQLLAHGVEPEFERIERLRLRADEPVATPAGPLVRDPAGLVHQRRARGLGFNREKRALDLRPRTGQFEFGGLSCRWRRFSVAPGWQLPSPRPGREYLDAGRVGRRVTLRHWLPGDRFQPLGLPGAVRLQDLFTNAKIPRDQRRAAVLAVDAQGELVWVEGLRLGEAAKVRSTTRRVLEWRWERPGVPGATAARRACLGGPDRYGVNRDDYTS